MRRVLRNARAAVAIATLAGACSKDAQVGTTPAKQASAAYSADWVLITVRSARLKPTSGADEWDAAEPPNHTRAQFMSLGSFLSFVDPTLGTVVKALASLTPESTPNSQATYPDPLVRVTLNELATARELSSSPLENTVRPSWDYAFYSRVSALRESGIDIQVFDHDGDAAGAHVGAVNLSRQKLWSVATSGETANLELANGELESLSIRLEPVPVPVAAVPVQITLPLADGLVPTGLRVPHGSILTVRVRGQGQVSGGGLLSCPSEVTPLGLQGGQCRNYNLAGLPELADAPHGAAVALIGAGSAVRAVGLADPEMLGACVRIVAPASGALVLGVNDRDPTNNGGEFTFEVSVEAPLEGAPALPAWCTGA